ncbi:hypothetical protein ACRAWG_15840 [Methylobacterium sp. P31]
MEASGLTALALRRSWAAQIHAALSDAWRSASESSPGDRDGFEALISDLQEALRLAERALRDAELRAA